MGQTLGPHSDLHLDPTLVANLDPFFLEVEEPNFGVLFVFGGGLVWEPVVIFDSQSDVAVTATPRGFGRPRVKGGKRYRP